MVRRSMLVSALLAFALLFNMQPAHAEWVMGIYKNCGPGKAAVVAVYVADAGQIAVYWNLSPVTNPAPKFEGYAAQGWRTFNTGQNSVYWGYSDHSRDSDITLWNHWCSSAF